MAEPSGVRWRGADALRALLVPLAKLRPDPDNARVHGERSLEDISASLAQFGQQTSVVGYPTDRLTPDGGAPPGPASLTVMAGNGTLEAARALGWTHMAVGVFTGTPDEARAYAIADNRTGELSAWDEEGLLADLQAMAGRALAAADAAQDAGTGDDGDDPAALLAATGFREDEVAALALRVGERAAVAAHRTDGGEARDGATAGGGAEDDDAPPAALPLAFDQPQARGAAQRATLTAFLATLGGTYPSAPSPSARLHAYLADAEAAGEFTLLEDAITRERMAHDPAPDGEAPVGSDGPSADDDLLHPAVFAPLDAAGEDAPAGAADRGWDDDPMFDNACDDACDDVCDDADPQPDGFGG